MCGPLRGCTRDGGVDAGGAPGAPRAELAGVPGAWRLTLLSRHTPGRRRRAEGSRPRPTPGKPLAEGRVRPRARNRRGRAGPNGIPPTLTASIRGRSSRFRASPPRPPAPRSAESESKRAEAPHPAVTNTQWRLSLCESVPPPPPTPPSDERGDAVVPSTNAAAADPRQPLRPRGSLPSVTAEEVCPREPEMASSWDAAFASAGKRDRRDRTQPLHGAQEAARGAPEHPAGARAGDADAGRRGLPGGPGPPGSRPPRCRRPRARL